MDDLWQKIVVEKKEKTKIDTSQLAAVEAKNGWGGEGWYLTCWIFSRPEERS